MKKILLMFFIAILSNISNAQSDIETLEKMYNMVENDRSTEAKAKEIVWNYYYQTKDQVREKSDKLTQKEYDDLNSYQTRVWGQITKAIKEAYGNNHSKFYSQKKKILEDYREEVLDMLYKYIYN